ncbi:MAG: DUF4139 domain-containing protein [Candidatus Omnitrophota bacterium]
MRKFIISCLVFLFLATSAYGQETVTSKIKQVTLFSDQALIEREAVTRAVKGPNVLHIGVDAFNVDSDSVSARVFGDGEILSVQYKEIYLKEPQQENIKALVKKIEAFRDTKRRFEDEKDILVKKERFLNSVIDFSGTQVPEEIKTNFPKAEDLASALTFLEDSFKVIKTNEQSLDVKIREIYKDIEVAQRELDQFNQQNRKIKKIIEVLFNSKSDQEVRILATYIAYNARWSPLYKVDVPLGLDAVSLIMFSKITQQTGEDWQDIKLSISNVIPLKGVGLPALNTWGLNIARPIAKRSMARTEFKEKTSEYSDKYDLAEMSPELPEPHEAEFVQSQKKELPFSFEYEMPQAITIESKDQETVLPLFSKDIKGAFYHYTAPQITPLTFLICNATADKELLAGPLNVYFAGRYVGKTFITEKRPGEDFEISLGADRDIKVKREKIKDKIDETFFGKIERQTIVRSMHFKITVENLKEKAAKVKLLDSIPVSMTDKIEVKDIKISLEPKDRKYQDKEGVMLWELALSPKAKQEIDIEFTITYPKDMPVAGI